jgi:mono/diheme cytochrome c family protein
VVDYIRSALMRVDAGQGISGTHARGVPQPEPRGARPAPAVPAPSPAPAPVKADLSLPMPNGLRGDAAAGRRFYEANCATCHGVQGDGQGPRAYFINPKPRVFTSEAARAALSRPALFAATSAGRRGTEMPAWEKVLSPQEIADVAEYVFVAFIQPGAGHAAARR